MKYSKKIICRRWRDIDIMKFVHRYSRCQYTWEEIRHSWWCRKLIGIGFWIDIKWVSFRNLWIDYLPSSIYWKVGKYI